VCLLAGLAACIGALGRPVGSLLLAPAPGAWRSPFTSEDAAPTTCCCPPGDACMLQKNERRRGGPHSCCCLPGLRPLPRGSSMSDMPLPYPGKLTHAQSFTTKAPLFVRPGMGWAGRTRASGSRRRRSSWSAGRPGARRAARRRRCSSHSAPRSPAPRSACYNKESWQIQSLAPLGTVLPHEWRQRNMPSMAAHQYMPPQV